MSSRQHAQADCQTQKQSKRSLFKSNFKFRCSDVIAQMLLHATNDLSQKQSFYILANIL